MKNIFCYLNLVAQSEFGFPLEDNPMLVILRSNYYCMLGNCANCKPNMLLVIRIVALGSCILCLNRRISWRIISSDVSFLVLVYSMIVLFKR